ncbi:MAG TPA: rhomboid family intramembrane serine protease [Devosiaceae bacterium]|jgi:membrane associated rhomboid family serine protease
MAEQGPEPEAGVPARQPIFMLPAVVTALAGIMLVIQLASSLILNDDGLQQLTLWFGFIPYRLIAPDQVPGGYLPLIWTLFTHAFLHAGWEHVLINVAWLLIFATPVARRYGAMPTLIVFLISSAVGAVAFAATTLPSVQVLVGASGGIAGLTGAAMRFIFQPLVVAPHPETGQPVILGREIASLKDIWRNPRARNFSLFWIVLNAAVPILPAFTGDSVQVAWQAHLGGFIAGLLLMPLFERRDAPILPQGDHHA